MNTRLVIGLQIAGVLMLAAGIGGLVYWQRTPAVLLEHTDPHLHSKPVQLGPVSVPDLNPTHLLAVSSYAQHVPLQKRPEQPHTGLWLEMPALQIGLPVRSGNGSSNIPQWQALVYPGTVWPGAPGNSYLYAHGLWGMFGGLLFARVGDTVLLHNYDTKTTQTLHVSKVIGKVHYNDSHWILMHSSKPTLILQTCIDFNLKGDRYLVEAS